MPRLMSFRFSTIVGVGLILTTVGAGCDGSPTDVRLPLLQTEEEGYLLRPAGNGLATEIGYTFENRTGSPVYLVNCGGAFDHTLERWEDERWITAWSPVISACLSAEIRIEEGEIFSDTLFVSGGLPGSNSAPQFHTLDLTGTYRIKWLGAYSSIEERSGIEPPILEKYRVSNSFQLTAP